MASPRFVTLHRLFLAVLAVGASTAWSQSVTTYHYDNNRTGWNSNETNLTPPNVSRPYFGLLTSVALDEQVDALPLYIPAVQLRPGANPDTQDGFYQTTEC